MAVSSTVLSHLVVIALFAFQVELGVAEWTFSLRIGSARCNQRADGSCDGLFMAMCLRHPGTLLENRESCPLFIAARDAATLLDRELTSADQVNLMLNAIGRNYIEFPYQGGIQLYIALLIEPDITPPFDNGNDMEDEVFVELSRVPSRGECATQNVVGVREHVSFTVSLSVDCYTGYSGDNCSCPGNTTCAISSFECPTLSSEIVNPSPSTSTSFKDASTSQEPLQTTIPTTTVAEPSATTTKLTTTTSESPSSKSSTSNSATMIRPSSTTTTTMSSSSSSETEPNPTVVPALGGLNSTEEVGIPLLVPVTTAAGVGVVLLILIVLVTICIGYRHRRRKKSYRMNLSHLMYEPKVLAPTIPPSDVRDNDGVTYSSVVHSKNAGHSNMGYSDQEIEKIDLSKVAKEAPPQPPSEVMTYAELDHGTDSTPSTEDELHYADVDHDTVTFTTFKKKNSWKRKPPPQTRQVQYVTVQRQDPHKYINVSDPPRPKPRKNTSSGQQLNVYSTVPAT